MQSLIDNLSYSNNARIELTRESTELETRLVPITAELNEKPLRVDCETWKRNLAVAEEEAGLLVDYCKQLAHNPDFRPNSPADCGLALEKRGIRLSRTKKGHPATSRDSLEELQDALAGGVLDCRAAIACRSQLRKWRFYAEAGFVQPVWDSMGQPHGRYTSAYPCLNNRILPIRETVEPDSGCSFLSVDLSQCEYVTWASLSGDLTLMAAFAEGRDFHVEMAKEIREAVPEWNPSDERQAGKTLNFAILYRMQVSTLARKLHCDLTTAEKIINAYKQRASVGIRYIQRVLKQAESHGYVETYFGRRRYLSNDGRNEHELQKSAWHHHNAGTAAEILKWKQLRSWEALRSSGYKPADVRLVLNMFDELIFQVRDNLVEEVTTLVESVFKEREPGFLQFQSEIKSGRNWREIS